MKKREKPADRKQWYLKSTLLVFDILVFLTTRFVGLYYGKIGPSGIVNGAVLYFDLFKGRRWARICFRVFAVLGIFVGTGSLLCRCFFPELSTAPAFGYANIVSGAVYALTLLLEKKLS